MRSVLHLGLPIMSRRKFILMAQAEMVQQCVERSVRCQVITDNVWPDIPDLRIDPCIPKKWKERDINKVNRTNRSPGSMLGKKKWWDK